jgi:cell division protease FtsH
MVEFEKAKDKIMMGAERRSMVMTEAQKESTAYHEAGHAIIGRLVPEHDPVHKVTIIPRGRALGVTFFLPEGDAISASRQKLESQISTLYGGRLAEEIIYGPEHVSTGASNDIKVATNLARNMVTQWGFSDKLGPLLYAEEEGEVFLGRSVAKAKHMSDETARIIDQEVKALIERNYGRARQILNDNMDILHSMKDALMKYETIDAPQIDDLMARREVRPPAGWEDQALPTILTTMAPRVRRVRLMNRVRQTRATPCQNSWATSKSLLLKRLSVPQTLELAPGFFISV